MKKAVFILGAPFALLLALLAAHFFGRPATPRLSKAPEHGVCFTLEADLPNGRAADEAAVLKDTLYKRFARFGASVFWEEVSPKQFRIYLPVVDKQVVEAAKALVSQGGRLELRLAQPDSGSLLTPPEGYDVMYLKTRAMTGTNQHSQRCFVSKTNEGGASGIRLRHALATRNSVPSSYDIQFKLTPESTEAFAKLTRENIGRQLALVVDGSVLSAPVIRSEIAGGAGVISGSFDKNEATQLAILLEFPLPCSVRLVETRTF